MKNKDLKRRIIEISYKYKLSHLSSCLSAVDIIDEIYAKKKKDEPFILSNGHAGVALYCVIEKYEGVNAEDIWLHHGVHPDRCKQCHLYCSTGSLGQGLPISLGMALADREKKVYCLISDGECSEGSIWESFRIQKEFNLTNLLVYVNINGYGAYKEINAMQLGNQIEYMSWAKPIETDNQLPFLMGLQGHYKPLEASEYQKAIELLS